MTQVPLTDEQELEPNEKNSQKPTYQILCHSASPHMQSSNNTNDAF